MAVHQSPKGPLPPALFLASLVLIASLHWFAPGGKVLPWPLNLLGAVVLGLGLAVTIAADRDFKRARTTVHPFGVPSALLTGGVYRYSRNPMYLGLVLASFGIALTLGSATPLAIPLLYGVILDLRFIRVEEARLQETFGASYTQYARHTRRWL
ncbi:MAG TPA: isoprenylcysteine carboxylmethyltransferase family protein [Gemmatimonadales bacterium]|nr:isoprenylcysteine carboxylmethyltransferase family protein [Gemmatimonadales bacterium]